jgi:ABC-type multidrug transport system, ATPase and permease components
VWDFRAKLLNHVQRLPLAFHDHYGAGDSVYCIQHDAPSLQYVVLQGILPLVIAAFTLAGMIFISVQIDPTISLLALAITPILFVLSMASSRIVRLRSRNIKELDSSAMSVVQEVLGFIRTIKAFGQEHREYERFVRHSSKRLAGQVRLARLQATFSTLIGLVVAAGTAAALYVGVLHVKAGKLSVGSLLVVMAYVVQMYQPLQALSTKSSDLQTWIVSLERTFALLDQPPEIAESPFAIPLVHAQGKVEFRNVSFHYGKSLQGLQNISFLIPAGARVGIVGGTGAGKTTLLNLIMRFMILSKARSCWMALTSGNIGLPISDANLQRCCRSRYCSMPASPKISHMESLRQAMRRLWPLPSQLALMSSSVLCLSSMTAALANGEHAFPAVNVSEFHWLERFCGTAQS